jgi:hypothetical protein
MRRALIGVALALWFAPTANATAPTRVLYVSDWSGENEVYSVDPTGRGRVAQVTHWHGACPQGPTFASTFLSPSPDGRYLAAECGTSLWLMRTDGSSIRRLVAPRGPYPDTSGVLGDPEWSRDSKLLGYKLEDDVHVLNVATRRERRATAGDLRSLHWLDGVITSPDGKWSAQITRTAVLVLRRNGLVYADGSRLHLVPYERLPLRGF